MSTPIIYKYRLSVIGASTWLPNALYKYYPVRAVNTRVSTDDVMDKMFVFGKRWTADDEECCYAACYTDYLRDAACKEEKREIDIWFLAFTAIFVYEDHVDNKALETRIAIDHPLLQPKKLGILIPLFQHGL